MQVKGDHGNFHGGQLLHAWEVFKIDHGNLAGTYQTPGEPSVLVPGKGDIDHYGLTVTLGGDRGAYGKDRGSQVPDGGAQKTRSKPGFSD
jgi:hypothetical protein